MITGAIGPFQGARAALVSFPIGIGCCVLATELALANTAPCFNKVRPTEQLVLATSADDRTLRRQLLALSPAVRPDEAERVVHCAYTTGRELAREWRVVWIPGIQNFLVNIGARKGGLCFQWASELLNRLDALRLQTLDLHWAESYAGTSAEHNVIVVTARDNLLRGASYSITGAMEDTSSTAESQWIPSTDGRRIRRSLPAD